MARRAWLIRSALFACVLASLFAASFAAGVRGVFANGDAHLRREIADPATRVDATAELASRVAIAIAGSHPVFPGAADESTCPARYAARASTYVEAMDADAAGETVRAASTALREAGWHLDDPVDDRSRLAVHAHSRQGFEVAVRQVPGSVATSIEVTVTVPCASVGEGATDTPTVTQPPATAAPSTSGPSGS